MSKRAKKYFVDKSGSGQINMPKQVVPEKYQDLIYCIILILSIYIFFIGAIFGGGFGASDNLASESFSTYLAKAKESGQFPHWLPYIFCGLPGYAALLVTGERLWDFIPQIIFTLTEFVGTIFDSDLARVLCFYAIYAIGMYVLMRYKEHNRFVSFITAFAAVFSTQIILWVMIGHNTKPIVFSMFPWIFLLIEKLREKFSIFYTAILIFIVHFMVSGSHIQMIFYGICAFGLYLLFELISRLLTKREPLSVVRVTILLLISGSMAFLMSADRYFSTMEYTPYSTRGSAPAVNVDRSQDATGGNTYEYATMWSFSPPEMITFFVPNYFGFGQMKYKGPLTNNREIKMPMYWGQKEFEDAPPYMGIVVIFLAIVGIVLYRRDIFIQFLIVLSVFSLLLSFGKNFSILYDLFYYYVPSFNKFRAPSMALALLQFAVPILAGYGLTGIINWQKKLPKEQKKLFLFSVVAPIGLLISGFLFTILFKSAYMDAVAGSRFIATLASNYGQSTALEFQKVIFKEMSSDWYMTGFLASLAGLFIYLYVKGKIKNFSLFAILIFLVMIIDLWRVGYRPMDYEDKKSDWRKVYFQKTDVINFLQQDTTIFRIADFASPTPNLPAYFLLENVGGYHSAKLRVYQDLLDVIEGGSTSNVTSPFLWNLMNVKYIITNRPLGENIEAIFQSQQTGQYVYYNPEMLERAFYVDSVIVADQPVDILYKMKNKEFNPAEVAYVEKSLPIKIDKPAENDYVRILQKENEYIRLEALSSGNNLMFISEIYYPPCWKAYIDGKETEIIKTNYAFRSIIIPAGKHIVEFKYIADQFEKGKNISLAANLLTLFVLIIGVVLELRNKRKGKSKVSQ